MVRSLGRPKVKGVADSKVLLACGNSAETQDWLHRVSHGEGGPGEMTKLGLKKNKNRLTF
jgi:hypothetical protein